MSESHPVPETEDPQARARALQSLLIEKDIATTDAIDEIISKYEEDVGPMNGAEVVAKAWTDPEYKQRLLQDASGAIDELGFTGLEGVDFDVYENTEDIHNVIVCTLCSCFPWPLLGLPPTWYKSPPYRSKMVKRPRQTLRGEFDTDIDDQVELKVWDTSAEVRYMVLPQRPKGSEGMSEEELAQVVTRDSMIGVERLGNKHVDDL
jgi:nitrile hydratase